MGVIYKNGIPYGGSGSSDVSSLQDIFDKDSTQDVVGDNSLSFIQNDAEIDLSDPEAVEEFENSSSYKGLEIDNDHIALESGENDIDFSLNHEEVEMNDKLKSSFREALGIVDSHTIENSAGTKLTQRDVMQVLDGLEAVDDSTNQKTKIKMHLPIVSSADWNAMTEQERTAYKASHYRFGVEVPDTEGVINAEYMKLLWENPNTTQAFPSQTINLSSSDYDMLLFTTTRGISTITEKGYGATLTEAGTRTDTATVNRFRNAIYVTDTSYDIGDALSQKSGGYNREVDNTLLIPVAIYGIKKNFKFKVNTIAADLSTRADHCFLDDEVTTVEDALTWKRYVEDSRDASITVSGVDFREIMVDVGNSSGTSGFSAARFSFTFLKGFATVKTSGYYATNSDFAQAYVTYDGDSTFTVIYAFNNTPANSYTNVYYR